MTPIERQIYDLVRRRPRTASELMALVWQLHPQDAPDRSNIKSHVWHMNRELRARGEMIRSVRGSHVEEPYRLLRLDDGATPPRLTTDGRK